MTIMRLTTNGRRAGLSGGARGISGPRRAAINDRRDAVSAPANGGHRQPRILDTDGETRASLATARGLSAGGFEVAVARSAWPAPAHWSRSVLERLVVPHPLDDEAGFVRGLQRALAMQRFAVLIPGSDASLLVISRARDALAPHTLIGLPPHDVVLRCLQKAALTSAASGYGLSAPAVLRCSTAAEALAAAQRAGFPVLVKPPCSVVDDGGARRRVGSRYVADERALSGAVAAVGGPCLVQASLSGAVVSFAGVYAGGALIGEAVSRYRRTWHPDGGSVTFSETVEAPPELRSGVIGLLGELEWEGMFELELIEHGDAHWSAIDLNPRPYGSLALAIGAGANLPALWCSYLLGDTPSPARARPGVFYRWEDGDLRHALWQLRRRDLRAAADVMRPHRGVVHPFFEPRDPGPLAAELLCLASSGIKRAGGPGRPTVWPTRYRRARSGSDSTRNGGAPCR